MRARASLPFVAQVLVRLKPDTTEAWPAERHPARLTAVVSGPGVNSLASGISRTAAILGSVVSGFSRTAAILPSVASGFSRTSMLLAAQFAGASILCAPPPLLATAPLDITWRLDNLDRIGGHPVTVAGTPRVVETDRGPAVEFNGRTDGLFIEANPLEGFARFTIDVSVQPAPGGPEEQRFLHIEEADTGNRALVELRMPLPSADGPEPRWSLDTYLRSAPAALTLLDRSVTHPAGRWHVVTLSYDGRTMSHWVDGVRELSGAIAFAPLGRGRTSVGVRQNRVSWFKGRIRQIVFRGESGSTGSGRAGPGGEP